MAICNTEHLTKISTTILMVLQISIYLTIDH